MHNGLFLKVKFQQSTYYRVPKTTEICRKALLSYFYIILSQIELEKVILVRLRVLCCKHDLIKFRGKKQRPNPLNLNQREPFLKWSEA